MVCRLTAASVLGSWSLRWLCHDCCSIAQNLGDYDFETTAESKVRNLLWIDYWAFDVIRQQLEIYHVSPPSPGLSLVGGRGAMQTDKGEEKKSRTCYVIGLDVPRKKTCNVAMSRNKCIQWLCSKEIGSLKPTVRLNRIHHRQDPLYTCTHFSQLCGLKG